MSKSLFITLVLFQCCFLVSGQANRGGQVIREKSQTRPIKAAKQYLDSLRKSQNIPGLSVCVGNRDKILWAEGLGFADLENQVPVSTTSMFRVGSVSKVMTALAVGLLHQRGKLNLDVPIQYYLPDYPAKQYSFTARQLASHTAGIRHYHLKDPINTPKRYKTVQEGLTIFRQDTLLFKPGSAYHYSTYGFNLLSAVVEAAAKKDFLSFMRDSVFLPLNMINSCPDYNDSILTGRVRFYENLQGKRVVNAALVDNSYKWAGGGFLSTPLDLVNMVRGLLNKEFLDENALQLLFTPQLLENGTNTHVGVGWRINENKDGIQYIHHGGLSNGGRTFLLFYPASGYIIAITANTGSARLGLDEAVSILQFFGVKHTSQIAQH